MTVREILQSALASRVRKRVGWANGIDEDTDLLEMGLIDSQGLLDLILEVEDRSGLQFCPERIDFDAGITLRKIADAFARKC